MVIRNLYRTEGQQKIQRVRQGARGIVINIKEGCPYILLNFASQDGRYDIPGGGVEEGESLEECCKREVEEETGYQVEILSKVARVNEYHEEFLFVNTYFICQVIGQTQKHLTESEERMKLSTQWLPFSEAKIIFSNYDAHEKNDFLKYEVYLREYTAISCVKEEYLSAKVHVRAMGQGDVDTIVHTFLSQGWNPNEEVYKRYWKEQEEGKREVLVAEVDGEMAGYLTLIARAKYGPFAGKYPEIKDFNVFEAYQKRGIGWLLMEEAEKQAKKYGDVVTLAVGLHAGYGSAQRMYIKRGYLPDGSGVWYRNRNLEPYASCSNDDDLILYLSKEVRYC